MLRLSAFSPSLSLSVHCLPAPPIPPPVVARRRRGLLPHGARFLALALPFLSRDEALSHLATLPQLPLSDLRATCTRLCLRSSRPGGPLLSATDLLVALHQLHSEGEALKAQVECLTRCIKDPALQRVFTSDHLRSALPRLAVLAPLPRLLMRTGEACDGCCCGRCLASPCLDSRP